MKHHVVLIYSREDADIAHRVRDDMRAVKLSVWTDENLELGTAEWLTAVTKAAEVAGCIVLITSSQEGQSDRVTKALGDLSKIVTVPIFHRFVWGSQDSYRYRRSDKSDEEPLRLSDSFMGSQVDYDAAIQSLIVEIGRNTLQAGPPPPSEAQGGTDSLYGGLSDQTKKEEKPDPPPPAPIPPPAPVAAEPPPPPQMQPAPRPAPQYQAPPAPVASASPSPGGLPIPSLPSLPSRTQPALAEPVEFTGFWPKTVQSRQSYALMIFAHVQDAISQVRDVAAGFASMMGNKQASDTASAQVHLSAGTLLTFVPQIDGLTFTPPEHTLIWEPGHRYQSVTFLFTIPKTTQTNFAGRILIFDGPLIVGEIQVTMQVASAVSTAALTETPVNRIEPIFASYSHRDTPVIEYFRSSRSHLGQKMLVDVYDLRAGERWADRLLEMIDESALFQLFWSQHSAQSEYVKQEWQHALKHLAARPRFIQPVWWETPMHPPPLELAHLHFQRIGLPPVTRLRTMLYKVKGLFGG